MVTSLAWSGDTCDTGNDAGTEPLRPARDVVPQPPNNADTSASKTSQPIIRPVGRGCVYESGMLTAGFALQTAQKKPSCATDFC